MTAQALTSSHYPEQGLLFYFSNKKNDYVFPSTQNSKDDTLFFKNYDLREKPHVQLSKSARKSINERAKYVCHKNIEDITEEEKNILRQYTGEGGLNKSSFGYLNQHYTDYPTIKAIFNAIDNSDFRYSRALEPAAGSGNFLGMRPDLNWTTVEFCSINNQILEKLYPKATHYNMSFEIFNKAGFDMIISNVPFAESRGLTALHSRPDIKALHDYYFIKAIELVNERGLIVFITSTYTMDGKSKSAIRQEITNKCDLLAAYRLPNGHFAKTANTEVQTDLIILQKKPNSLIGQGNANNDLFINVEEYQPNVYLNRYYLNNPDKILGKIEVRKDRFGKESIYVQGTANLKTISFDLNYASPVIAKEEKCESSDIPDNLKEFEAWEAKNDSYLVKKNISSTDEDGSSFLTTDKNFLDDFLINSKQRRGNLLSLVKRD